MPNIQRLKSNEVKAKHAKYDGHFLCGNCPEWHTMMSNRLSTMGHSGADCVLFDITHMPEKGCWCINCREKYASSSLCAFDYETCKNNYVKGDGITLNSPIKQVKIMRDFMNLSQIQGFLIKT